VDWIAAASIYGFLMWIWGMLFYMKTTYGDDTMSDSEPPVAWFWMNLSNTTMGWTAASYLTWFIFYLLISTVEFVAWLMFYAGDNGMLLSIWAPVSFWGASITYVIPPVLAMLQIWMPVGSGGINAPEDDGWINAINLIVFGLTNWIFQAIVHMVFSERVVDHIVAKNTVTLKHLCKCTMFVADEAASEEENKAAKKASLKACYDKLTGETCVDAVKQALKDKCGDKAFSDCTLSTEMKCDKK